MEGQSTDNNTSNNSNVSGSALVEVDAADAIVVSSSETRQLSTYNSMNFSEMLGYNYDDLDLNIPYINFPDAPPVSDSTSPAWMYATDSSNIPCCIICGKKRKTPNGSFEENNEGSHGNIEECQCPVSSSQSSTPDSPPITQEEGTSNPSSRPARNRTVNLRKRPESVRRSLPPSHDPRVYIPLTTYYSRTSVSRDGDVRHDTHISSYNSNQVALTTGVQPTGTTRSQYVSFFGQLIRRPIRPRHNPTEGSSQGVEGDGSHVGVDMGNGNGGGISNAIGADRNIFEDSLRANAHRRQLMAMEQAQREDDRAQLVVANASLAASSRVATRPGVAREIIRPALANPIPRRLNQDAQLQAQGTNIQGGDDGLNWDDVLSDEDIARHQRNLRVRNARLLREENILRGLNSRRYISSGKNEEEEKEICCICLDQFGTGQDLVKLDCCHRYHFQCIKRWLDEKNFCAVCKRVAIAL